jgi:hypothetical protein
MNKSEKIVQTFLRTKGLHVKRISQVSQLDERRPDFLVEDDIVLEVKSRGHRKFDELLKSTTPGEKSLSLERRNTISGIIKGAVDQLSSFMEEQGRFRVVWFFINATSFSHLIARQIISTVYGIKEVEGYTVGGNRYETGCFYLTYNDFYRYRELDAIVTHGTRETALCLNDFSPRYQDLHMSSLHKLAMAEEWVIFDPRRMEQEGRCFTAADCDLDRDNREAILRYIAKRYGLIQIASLDTELFNLPITSDSWQDPNEVEAS